MAINTYMLDPEVRDAKPTMEYGSYVKIVNDSRYPPVSGEHPGAPWNHYAVLTRDVDRMPGLSIAIGDNPDQTFVQKYGFNEDLDAVTNGHEQTIWSAGGAYPWSALDTSQTLLVTSTSVTDVDINISIQGLNDNWELVTETVTLLGTDTATVPGLWRRVFRAYVDDVTPVTGEVVFVTGDTNAVVAEIMLEEQQTLMAIYTVPAGYTAYLTCFESTVSRNEDMLFRLRTREFGGVFRTQHVAQVYESPYRYSYDVYKPLAEKTDIELTGSPTNNNVSAHGAFDLILIKNA